MSNHKGSIVNNKILNINDLKKKRNREWEPAKRICVFYTYIYIYQKPIKIRYSD